MKPPLRTLGLLLFLLAGRPASALEILVPGIAFGEDFNGLAGAGTANTALPAGWSFLETGSGANATYAAGAGSSGIGNVYSFGANGSADRALGALRSASVGAVLGTRIVNRTGGTLADLALAFTGEQWRLGAPGRADRLEFAYSLDAPNLAGGTWTAIAALDFTAPVATGPTGALDGNAPAHRLTVAHVLAGLDLPPDAGIWIRWTDADAAGADDGLGIDDFVVTGIAAPAPVPESLPGWLAVLAVGVWFAAATVVAPAQRFTNGRIAAMWSGVLPQQPPTILAPAASRRGAAAANCAADSA